MKKYLIYLQFQFSQLLVTTQIGLGVWPTKKYILLTSNIVTVSWM